VDSATTAVTVGLGVALLAAGTGLACRLVCLRRGRAEKRRLAEAAAEADRLRAELAERREVDEERRRVEDHARQLAKWESLGAMASGIAHDFNNLLVGVLGNAELALDAVPADSPARGMIEEIHTSGMRAADLIGQMMAFAGQGRARIERVRVDALVREMEPLIRAAVPRRTALRLEFPAETPPIEADVSQLRQAFMNVVLNAAEAIGSEAGEIAVRIDVRNPDRQTLASYASGGDLPEGKYVVVEIRDTGPGMDAATLEKLYDPFFTTKFEGRGVGLPAVLGILRGHGGGVKAESTPSRGSTFTLLFPVAPAPAPAGPDAAAGPAPAATVLIVDDEEAVSRVARRMLEQEGFRALTAQDGRAAADLFWARRHEIDAVILDLAMPALGGEEVFLVLRNIRPDVPVLLASGFTEDEARRRFGERNVDGFIKKPFRSADLVAALRAVLASRRRAGSEPSRA
jgi:two-component system, cell cycle sensor histidine kinase and response regulator CckA